MSRHRAARYDSTHAMGPSWLLMHLKCAGHLSCGPQAREQYRALAYVTHAPAAQSDARLHVAPRSSAPFFSFLA